MFHVMHIEIHRHTVVILRVCTYTHRKTETHAQHRNTCNTCKQTQTQTHTHRHRHTDTHTILTAVYDSGVLLLVVVVVLLVEVVVLLVEVAALLVAVTVLT